MADEKQQARIQQLAAMSDEQAIKSIHEQANREVGKYGTEAVEAVERNLAQIVARYKEDHAVHVTGFADVLVREKVAGNVNVGSKGNTSYGVSGQAHVGEMAGVNVFAGGSMGLDKSGVTGGSVWANGIGKPLDIGDAHVIPVSQVAVNIPAHGKFGPGNVTGMVGAVINPDGTHGNIATLASATADGKNANVFVDYSHDINIGKGVIATPHVGVTQQFMGDQGTGVSGGARFHDPHMIDKTTGVALNISAGSGNLREKDPGWNVGATVEVTFNNAEAKKESPLEQAFKHAVGKDEKVAAADTNWNSPVRGVSGVAEPKSTFHHENAAGLGDHAAKPNIATAQQDGRSHTTIEPKAQSTQVAAQHLDSMDFLKLSHKEQVVVVNRMAENYVKEHPGVGREDARETVVHALLNPQRENAVEMSHGQHVFNHHQSLSNLQY